MFTIHDYTGTALLEDLAVVLSESKTQTQLHSMKPDLSINILFTTYVLINLKVNYFIVLS